MATVVWLVRRRIVSGMEVGCALVDCLPWWVPLHRLGCPNGMAVWSYRLDKRWQTRVWNTPEL